MQDCIFCKIINHEIPASIVYEDEKVIAFLDLSQATKGHTLVVPKVHSDDITKCKDDDLVACIRVAKILARTMMQTLPDCKGVNILNNCHEVAGQTIMHTHIHVIPRYENDDLKIEFKDHSNENNLDEIVTTLTD